MFIQSQEMKEPVKRVTSILYSGDPYLHKDRVTLMHALRMSVICKFIGLAYGMSDTTAEILLHASYMHDLGKKQIPDSVLMKPGRLDSDEWSVMKAHTTIGAKIIGEHSSEPLRTAKTIALTHHERWDGSGYPNGLFGKQIPLEGRIVAICDVFDALTNKRPYKRVWREKEAIEAIKKGSGSHFDPSLAHAFLEAYPEIRRIGPVNMKS